MNDPLDNWLQEWGAWLDALLATGLACPTRETRARIGQWCADAQALGFATQCAAAQTLLGAEADGISDGPSIQARAQVFIGLLLEQDMLLRLHEAQRLMAVCAKADGEDNEDCNLP
ncbi:MAG: hypothetical protein V4812_04610 [Pseudomonadota bacterium]